MTLMAHFQYRLAIASQKGYARSIAFNIDPSLAGAPFIPASPRAGSLSVGGKGTERPLMSRRVLVEDCELTEAQLRKRQKNLRYRAKLAKRRSPEFFRQAKAQLTLVWPTQES
jgi:hypothetical protein